MTKDELLKLLNDIDHRCIFTRDGDIGGQLAKAIAWLEDEKNRRGLVSADFEHGLLTISGHFESGWVL